MNLISTITVFGFLEIQSNDVPVDDKPSVRCILNQINKTYTCTCLGYEFRFKQHSNVTRQSCFFQPLSTYLRLVYIISFCFSLGTVNVYFRGDLQYSLSISLTLQSVQKLKGCLILKKGAVFQRQYISKLY